MTDNRQPPPIPEDFPWPEDANGYPVDSSACYDWDLNTWHIVPDKPSEPIKATFGGIELTEVKIKLRGVE